MISLRLGFDVNKDGTVNFLDLWVYLVGLVKERFGKRASTLGLDELHEAAVKKQHAVKQNAEILAQCERIEAMLLAMGGPDLRTSKGGKGLDASNALLLPEPQELLPPRGTEKQTMAAGGYASLHEA